MQPLHTRLTLALLLALAGHSQAATEPGTATDPASTGTCQQAAATDEDRQQVACSEQAGQPIELN